MTRLSAFRLVAAVSLPLIFACAPSATTPSRAAASPAVTSAPADSAVSALLRKTRAPSVSVLVARNGSILYRASVGMADLENGVRAHPGSVYRVASLAKPLTATAVLQLAEQGQIDLGYSIRRYLPSLPDHYQPVTIQDLLRHTGGVRHYGPGEFISTLRCDSLGAALRIFAGDPLDHAPGEKITYSSYGYTLLGLAVERATGVSYVDYVRGHVLEPADMRSTYVDDLRIIPNRVQGYTGLDDGSLRNADLLDTSCRIPAGGFVSTTEDMIRFVEALESGVLLSATSVREMMRSQLSPEVIARTLAGVELPPGYEPPGIGFGWAIAADGLTAYHGGNQPGFTAMLYHATDRNITVAVLTNLGGIGDALTDLARHLADLAYDEHP